MRRSEEQVLPELDRDEAGDERDAEPVGGDLCVHIARVPTPSVRPDA